METKITYSSTRIDSYQSPLQMIKQENWRLFLLFIFIFGGYLLSMPKTVVLEDDGLFIMSSYFAGTAHPPGYPLHTLIGNLFSQIPFGSVASRIHAVSAVFGALACVLLSLLVMQLLGSRLAAYSAAMILAWSPVYWSQSIIAEVYSLNIFFFFLVLLLLISAVNFKAAHPEISSSTNKTMAQKLSLLAFFYGLSLSNHWPFMVLSSPCFLIMAWPIIREIYTRYTRMIVCFLLGLTPYLWLYLHSSQVPEYSVMGPINNLDDLWYYISRQGYSGVDNSPSAGLYDKLSYFLYFSKLVFMQFFPIATLFAILGFIVQRRFISVNLSIALLVGFLVNGYLLIGLMNFDFDVLHQSVIRVYFLPAFGIVALWCAFGIHFADQKWAQITAKQRRPKVKIRYIVPIATVVLIIVLNIKGNFRHNDNWTAWYADAVFAGLEEDAVVFTDSEVTAGPLGYFHMIENKRPDIELRNSYGMLYGNRLIEPRNYDPDKQQKVHREYLRTEQRRVFYTTAPNLGVGYRFDGLLYSPDIELAENQRIYTLNETTLNFLLGLAENPGSFDIWTAMHQQEILQQAIPFFVHLYITEPQLREESLFFFNSATLSIGGKIALVNTLFQINEPEILSGVDVILKQISLQLQIERADKKDQAAYYILSAQRERDSLEKNISLLKQAMYVWPHPDNKAMQLLEKSYSELGRLEEYHQYRLTFIKAHI